MHAARYRISTLAGTLVLAAVCGRAGAGDAGDAPARQGRRVAGRNWLEMDFRIRRNRRQVRDQMAENTAWLREAVALERAWVERGQAFFDKREFRRARACYLKALAVRYPQWVFTERALGSHKTSARVQRERLLDEADDPEVLRTRLRLRDATLYEEESVKPATGTRLHSLDTDYTQLARHRLGGIERRIEDEDLLGALAAAEGAVEAGKPAAAYRHFKTVLDRARRMGENALAARAAAEALTQRRSILAAVAEPLEQAEEALAAGRAAAAADWLAEFVERFRGFGGRRDLVARYERLALRPEVRAERDRREAARQLAAGEKALVRGDYVSAVRRLEAAARLVSTPAGVRAAARLAALRGSEVVREAVARQKAEYKCLGLLARARWLAQQNRVAEALQVYGEVRRDHPGTPWAEQAALAAGALGPAL
jgi:tetratricopeptide (TPR) repeat protein